MLVSSGILAYRQKGNELEFFLVHPGGPFFAKKDEGFWTVPKGLVEEHEDLLVAAKREFLEETSIQVSGDFISLGDIVQKGAKRVHCFGVAFDLDATLIKSNTFEMEWPPRTGRKVSFPEVDRGEWFPYHIAKMKINSSQAELLDRLIEMV